MFHSRVCPTKRNYIPLPWIHRCGLSLIEIMAAILILGFAALPMIGILSNQATDADLANSAIFAQNSAANVLNSVLDNVPFDCIQVSSSKITDLDGSNPEANVAKIIGTSSFQVASFLGLLGNKGIDAYARGELKDERGNVYKMKLYVFPVETRDQIDLEKELTFSYLPRPQFENAVSGYGKPCWYSNDQFVSREVGQLPYDSTIASVTRNAKILGAPPGPDGSHCIMKKLLLKVRWKGPKKSERSVEIVTAKGNLGREENR